MSMTSGILLLCTAMATKCAPRWDPPYDDNMAVLTDARKYQYFSCRAFSFFSFGMRSKNFLERPCIPYRLLFHAVEHAS